ncbi:MAG: hypothetical protein HYU28_09295 [Actinobacteria bacterium]|nr:hypothetical protein [Actinomycetota bacterium]
MGDTRTAMIQVLGAIAYGEWKAYEGARARATEADSEEERAAYKKIAAEELRHHKGFARRLEAMGADLERAMAPYKGALDTFHSTPSGDPLDEAVGAYLGEGVADDLLEWLRKRVDSETAEFIDSVIADEEEHEALATEKLRAMLDSDPDGRARAARAARKMVTRMLGSSGGGATQPLRFLAFLRIGAPHELMWALTTGYVRRLRALGIDPFRVPISLPVLRARAA